MKYLDISQIEKARPFYFSEGSHALLLIHGFTGSAAHMQPIAHLIREKGYAVKGINLLGHGSTLMDMKGISWKDWSKQVEEEYLKLKEKYLYVSVAGLSMGGVLTLDLASKYPLTCAITYSAPMALRNPLARLAGTFASIYPVTKWKMDKNRAKQLEGEFDIGYEGFPTGSTAELIALIKNTKKNLSSIKSPLLVVQSKEDKAISKDSGEIIIAGVSSEVKDLMWLEDVPHVITISRDTELIARRSAKFMQDAEKLVSAKT